MKVLFLVNTASGILDFRTELVERLVRDGHEVVFSVPEAAGDPMVVALEALGARHVQTVQIDRRGTNPAKDLRLLSSYEDLLRAERPDVVLTYTIKPNVWGGIACQRVGVPYIANITGLGTAVENGGALQKLALSLYKRGLKGARRVFFQNAMNRDFMLSHGVVAGQYSMLPGSGVNLQRYEPLPYPNDGEVAFSFISRVMEQKGIEQFLDAAEAVMRRHPEARFHVYGRKEGGYAGRLDALAQAGVVQYHGNIDDVREAHKASSCTVHPSYYPEGMSNVLLESCACARPIITTGRPGCGEAVDDGVNGFVVRERDSADLVDKIERFLAMPWAEREAMGLAGRAKVEREFDRQIVVERYMEEIEGVRGGD